MTPAQSKFCLSPVFQCMSVHRVKMVLFHCIVRTTTVFFTQLPDWNPILSTTSMPGSPFRWI